MRKLLMFLLLAVWFSLCLVGGPVPSQAKEPKVTICHRTNSETNPYVQITVDTRAVDGPGGGDHFAQHKGPVFSDGLKDSHTKWGDIIPPVKPYHDGLNWTAEGRVIYDNGCKTVTPPEQTTTTTVLTTTTTVRGGDSPPPAIDGTVTVERSAPAPAVPLTHLPRTGKDDGWLALLGLSFIVVGLVLIAKGASLRR